MSQLINVDNIKGNFYGGLPYGVTWSFGNGTSPSTLAVQIVSKNGKYATPQPTYNKLESIKVGDFNFEGYLVKYSFSDTPSAKLLELSYVDRSCNLEKWFVGLHKKQGNKFTNKTPRLILVGKEYHPCDTNQDSTVAYVEADKLDVDPCDPCPFMPDDKYGSTCDAAQSNFEVFDVYYTFNELVDRLPKEFNAQFAVDPANYNLFKAQHAGSLGEVLSRWCDDLGLAYYWDPFKNSLIFISRSNPILIPDAPDDITIIDLKQGSSIENTFSRGVIATMERAGSVQSYSCQKSDLVDIKPLRIKDLGWTSSSLGHRKDAAEGYNLNTWNYLEYPTQQMRFKGVFGIPTEPQINLQPGVVTTTDDIRELIIAVTHMGKAARDAFIWMWWYRAVSIENMYALCQPDGEGDDGAKENNELIHFGLFGQGEAYSDEFQDQLFAAKQGQPEGSSGKFHLLAEFGFMEIMNVYHPKFYQWNGNFSEESNKKSRAAHAELTRKLPQAERERFLAIDKKNYRAKDDPSWYFFAAKVSDGVLEKQFEIDSEMARNFLGKYWFRRYNSRLAGVSNRQVDISVETPDGASAEWYRASDTMKGSSIFSHGHSPASTVGGLAVELSVDSAENNYDMIEEKKEKELDENGDPTGSNQRTAVAMILMERSTKWLPTQNDLSNYSTLMDWYADLVPRVFGNENGRPEWFTGGGSTNTFGTFNYWGGGPSTEKKLHLFIARFPDYSFDTRIEWNAEHPLESPVRDQYRNENEDEYGNLTQERVGPWGLASNSCVKITLPGGLSVYCPVGSMGNVTHLDPEGINMLDRVEEDRQHYTVMVNQNGTVPKVLPKLSYVHTKYGSTTNVAKVDYQLTDVQEDNLKVMSEPDQCVPSKKLFADYAEEVFNNGNYEVTEPQRTMSFKAAGVVPLLYDISQGLTSLNISISDNGVHTSYNFADQVIKPPSSESINTYLRDSRERNRTTRQRKSVTNSNGESIRQGSRGGT